ncbi:MAG: RNA polymerase sigma factor, partial [bacterium]|nr:RNA polymerase sigma factor [bacterium]
MQQTTDEQHLVDRLKQRDPAAFNILLQMHKNQVANICYRFLFNREDAEEMAQEVFITIYKNIASFRGDSKLSTWIYHLASSKSIDLIRSRKRKKRLGHVKSLLGLQEEGVQIPDPQSENPLDTLENEEKGRIIREAIDSLPPKYREVFTLSKCDGLANQEVADIMGLTKSSVDSLIHRANKKLRKILYSAFESELKKQDKKVQKDPGDNVSNNGRTFFIFC